MPRNGEGEVRPTHIVPGAKIKGDAWLSHVAKMLDQSELGKTDVVTWAGFNSQLMNDESIKPQAMIGILPLFPDKAATPSMMKHTMEIVKELKYWVDQTWSNTNPWCRPTSICHMQTAAMAVSWYSLGEDKFVMQWEHCTSRTSANWWWASCYNDLAGTLF